MFDAQFSSSEPNVDDGFRVGALRVEPASGAISGPAGREQVDPKVMAVLVALARRPGELVTRGELLKMLWPGRVVTDDTLTQCVYQLRRHLDAAGGDPQSRELVSTLPKRGYRLDGKLRPAYAAAGSHRAIDRATWRTAGLFAALMALIGAWWLLAPSGRDGLHGAPDESPSIAVLPFEDMSPGRDQEYLADGMAEELINSFTRIPDLRVVSRTSSFSFKDKGADIQTMADSLGVSNVLEGSVRRAGDRILVTAQLIDGETATHLWSRTYERNLDDIFAVQREIAADVARSLRLTLSSGAVVGNATPPDPEAYKHYLQARHFWERRSPGDIELAGRHFKRAVEIDPGFARAWTGLAGFYWAQAGSTLGWEEGVRKSGDALERALSIDPTLPEAHARAWGYYQITGHDELAEMHAAKALKYGRNNWLVLSYGLDGSRALKEGREGREDLVVERLRRMQQINPLSAVTYNNAGHAFMAIGRYEEAVSSFEKANDFNPARTEERKILLTMIKVLRGRHEEAIEDALTFQESPERDQILAKSHFALGREAKAKQAMARLKAAQDGEGAFRVAEVHGYRGDVEAAFEWLERIPERMSDTDMIGRWPPWEIRLRVSPSLRSLRDDPRWEPLIARMPRSPTVDAPPLEASERLAAQE